MKSIKGQITIVDLTDSRQLVAYIATTNRRQVIYDPTTDKYSPDYASSPITLEPELYIAGGGTNIINNTKSVKWTVQTNSTGRFEPITADATYQIGTNKQLVISSNVLKDRISMLYRVEIIYTDPQTERDIIIQADMELVRLENGSKGDKGDTGDRGYTPVKGTDYFDGRDGLDGTSNYLWVRYSKNSNGDPMDEDPKDATYLGTATTEEPQAPEEPSEYVWVEIKGDKGVPGEEGENGETSYLHIKYSNDGGKTFTSNNGEDVGEWIGTYVDFTEDDSNEVTDYTWNQVKGDKGDKGDDAYILVLETPDGTSIRNSEGTVRIVTDLYKGASRVTPTNYKWYKRIPGASGDTESGEGWSRLTSSNNYGTTGYNTATLTVPPQAITGHATYMVIATYDGKTFRNHTSLDDITDPYSVSALGDNFFKNGQGTNTYLAKIYQGGQEIDLAGNFTYTWHQYSSTGSKVVGFEKVGKEIEVKSDEFSGKGELRVTVTK